MLMDIKYPAIRPRAKKEGETTYIWDSLRGSFLVLTPEEWVRQHIISYLINECGFAPQTIVQEYPVALNGTAQRADIVVMDSRARALMLVECKAMDLAIDDEVFAQAVRYNSVVKARYIVLSNGVKTACYASCSNGYRPIDYFPHSDIMNEDLDQAE